MGTKRHPFTPGFDAVKARLVLATTQRARWEIPAPRPSDPLRLHPSPTLSPPGSIELQPALDADHNGVINGRDADPLLKSLIPQTPPTHLRTALAAAKTPRAGQHPAPGE